MRINLRLIKGYRAFNNRADFWVFGIGLGIFACGTLVVAKVLQDDPDAFLVLEISEHPGQPFSTTVDWYKPPAKATTLAADLPDIPAELMIPVLKEEREGATTLLGGRDIILLQNDQARELTGVSDVDASLRRLTERWEGTLRILESDPSQLQQLGHDETVGILRARIEHYKAWQNCLSPYLIKAVSLNEQGLGYHGTLVGNVLFVDQICAVGEAAVPMKRMPIVAFLPRRPDAIYTTFTTFR